ncbi:MAG: response regulator [Rhodanobacteraceae bacterium]
MAATNREPTYILLVEDEEFLREVATESLQDAGYEVLAAGDGDAGLKALQSDATIDVLLSDIRLPGLDGYQLAEAGKALRPHMKLILMTGYAPDLPATLKQAVFRVLQKPFRVDSLSSVVAAALGRTDGASQ